MTPKGSAWKFGDNISTDLIAPGRYFHLRSNLPEMAKHVMEDADPSFASKVNKGDFIVGGSNFGLGSSREHAPTIIKLAGVSAVLAKSFARIFYRNSINIGLPILESPEAAQAIAEGHEIEVDLGAGRIRNLTTGASFTAHPFPEGIRAIMAAGGMVGFVRARLGVDAPAQPGRERKRSQG